MGTIQSRTDWHRYHDRRRHQRRKSAPGRRLGSLRLQTTPRSQGVCRQKAAGTSHSFRQRETNASLRTLPSGAIVRLSQGMVQKGFTSSAESVARPALDRLAASGFLIELGYHISQGIRKDISAYEMLSANESRVLGSSAQLLAPRRPQSPEPRTSTRSQPQAT